MNANDTPVLIKQRVPVCAFNEVGERVPAPEIDVLFNASEYAAAMSAICKGQWVILPAETEK